VKILYKGMFFKAKTYCTCPVD